MTTEKRGPNPPPDGPQVYQRGWRGWPENDPIADLPVVGSRGLAASHPTHRPVGPRPPHCQSSSEIRFVAAGFSSSTRGDQNMGKVPVNTHISQFPNGQ